MSAKGVQAWVTSAVDDITVKKAVVLAGSLRRVRTSKKLAVLTTLAVSEELREKLEDVFDLVVLLETRSSNGLSLEEYAKIKGFSLQVFSKCAYLAPHSLVLRNCDDIFTTYEGFAVCSNNEEIDTSIYVFTPSMSLSRSLQKIVHCANGSFTDNGGGNFTKYFKNWMANHIPDAERLEKQYNVKISLMNNIENNWDSSAIIANFVDSHPLDFTETQIDIISKNVGAATEFVIRKCLTIYNEDILTKIPRDFSISDKYETEPIAIVGLSFRLPGGNSPDEFWDLLVNGKEAIRQLPPSRWRNEHICFPHKDRKVEAGFLSIPIDEFDAKFFGISPKEAVFLDPQQRLLHEMTWYALEDAGIDPLTLHRTQTGVYVGSWIHDYKDITVRSVDVDFFRAYMGNSIAATAARLSHFFGTTGPSIATESGCSSGIVAVDMACKSLRNHESNLAIACGVNLLIHPFDQNTLSFVMSPDGRCKTFDAKADGFGRAEGCAVLLMKRLSDAVRDENKIWGLMRGSAVVQEGVSKSLGTPTVYCESLAMELALKDAGVQPKDVSFIETHGTGTSVGDPMEIAAITKAYTKGRSDRLIIGSVKTNVGHTESVSGITGIIKVLLSLHNETIPPHINFETLNPDINLDAIPAEIPLQPLPWPRRSNKPRIAGVSSFGISGTDGHAIIEEAPIISRTQVDYKLERPLHIIKISAKSQESLEELLSMYEDMFRSSSKNDEFADIAYSANVGRATFNHRVVLVANNVNEAAHIMQHKSFKQSESYSGQSKMCFLFTGQGSQYPNMASTLYRTSPVFRNHFDKCSDALEKRYNISIATILWGNATDSDKLSRTLYSQISIFCVEYCLLKLWESWGVKPDFVMGHSLGEFAAAVAAGVLNFEDALMLVAERSRLIDSLHRGKMLVIRADKKTVDQTVKTFTETRPKFWVDYAALNTSDQTVVAGDSNMIDEFAKFCEEKALKTIVLAATHAFHSRHMDPMLEEYRKIASKVSFKSVSEDAPKYISGMEGKLIEAQAIDADYWVRHTREKVSFIDACKAAQSEGCTMFLEVGPHPVLSALAMMNIEGASVKCFPSIRRKEDEWVTLLDSLSKLYVSDWKGEINWKGFDQFYCRERVHLPFYPFNRKPIWIKIRRQLSELHPLLGKIVPNAANQSIYERDVTVKNTSFVKDHIIGNTIIYPMAAFLESILAAGYASVQGLTEDWVVPRRAIAVNNLRVASPLALHDVNSCVIQTVVTLDDKEDNELGYSVAVHRNNDPDNSCGGQWLLHASGDYQPVPKMKTDIPKINIEEIKATWSPSENKDFYEKLPEVGLRFGPKFQSLQMAWKSEDGILLQVKVPEDTSSYLVHPVVGDAMIQAIMLTSKVGQTKKLAKLQVPIQIGEFVWLSTSECSGRYIYSSTNNNGGIYSLLLDDEGLPLAYMSDVDFAETSVKLIEGMIQQQSVALPDLWEEIFKRSSGPMQNRIDMTQGDFTKPLSPEQMEVVNRMNDVGEAETNFHTNVCNLTRHFFLAALYKQGWSPTMGQKFMVDELMSTLGLRKNFKLYIRFFLKSLSDIGIITAEKEDLDEFSFTAAPPTSDEISKELAKVSSSEDFSREEFKMILEIGKNLLDILSGRLDPLKLLFPDDPSRPNAEKFYDAVGVWTEKMVQYVNRENVAVELLRVAKAQTVHGNAPVIRILEVGAGKGTLSGGYMKYFEENDAKYEYWFTDISAAFFSAAEVKFEKHLKNITFKKFNMEEDPLQQGLCPEYFDMILACEVIHIAKDVRTVLQHLRRLLKRGGLFQIIETVTFDVRNTFVFGLLEGFWQFEDFDLRPYHAALSGERWKQELGNAQFSHVECIHAYNNVHGFIKAIASNTLTEFGEPSHSWIIFGDDSELTSLLKSRFTKVNRKVEIVFKPSDISSRTEEIIKQSVENAVKIASQSDHFEGVIYLWGLTEDNSFRTQEEISLPFMSLCQVLTSSQKYPKRVYAVTQGVCSLDGGDAINPSPGTLIGLMRAMANENMNISFNHMDLSPDVPATEQIREVFYNLWSDDDLAFRDGKRFVPKFASLLVNPNKDYLQLPNGCDRYQLALPKTRLISDLEFAFLEPYTLDECEVEIQVKAVALNFRDVMTVLKPIPYFETFNSVGLDVSGIITKLGSKVTSLKLGDKVIGFNMDRNLALPSHIKLLQHLVIPLQNLTYAEGATLPTVFLTSLYCLTYLAKMKKGETVLIHTASGGVGLCAIQIAKKIGAHVIATAGSKRKQTFLKNLGVKHVFHSRNTNFSKQIMEVTNGVGVDIVLNSLTGPGFKEASLTALKMNGRFIEMSKLNVWTVEEVQEIRKDVFYATIDLTELEKKEYEALTQELQTFLKEDFIKPIPYERFDALNIRAALYYLQKASHVGKIVCIMPEVKMDKGKFVATTPLFNDQSTYLITGGLGGIGFEVVKWMLNNGAKYIAIANRSEPKPEIADQIDSWNKCGKHVQVFAVDVGNYEQCEQLFEHLKSATSNFPQLRGVMHAAGVLQDAMIENQCWSNFMQTFNPKVYGSWNLHDLTKDLVLEHFVLFSSIAASFGSPGQTNHSASNSFEDALALYRKSIGLPSTSVNWGIWGEVGVATEIDFPGVRPISTFQGLLALETFLKTQRTRTAVLNIDSFAMLSKLFPRLKSYVDDKRLFGEMKSHTIINTDEFWAKVDEADCRESKLEVFKEFIKSTVKSVLKMDAIEEIEDNVEFQELGIDSLMMLEMKNGLQNILGSRMTLTAAHLKDCSNTEILANRLVDLLEGEEDKKNLPTQEELNQLIREDSILPDHIIAPTGCINTRIDQVQTVLLTGVTGTLGPYFLRNLTQRENIKKVYCLIRKSGKVSATNRLLSKLKNIDILDEVNMDKVECLQGDITGALFGLSEETYEGLAETVDAIIHSAVLSDHNVNYWKAPLSRKSHVRTANVHGTMQILEFAIKQKLKHVYHVSTLLTVTSVDESRHLSEEWQDVGAFDEMPGNLGYAISKHICEQLVKVATVERGIPCKVFRLPFIGGDSRTGRCDIQSNHLMLRCLGFMKLGCMPDVPIPIPIIPVDAVADLTLDIFLDIKAQSSDVYHVCPRNPDLEQGLISIAADFGIQINPVQYSEFVETLKSIEESSPLSPFAKRYQEEVALDNASSPSALCYQRYFENSTDFFTNQKISNICPNFEENLEPSHVVIRRDLQFLKDAGVFKRFEIGS